MTFHPDRLPRRSIRLQEYDYTREGLYFVTVCTHQRECFFGNVVNGGVILTKTGEIVSEYWSAIPDHFSGVELDAHILMPNHLHGIIFIAKQYADVVGATHGSPLHSPTPNLLSQRPKGPPSGSLGAIIGQFKSSASRRLKDIPDAPFPLWQRNYYEHIVRNENDLNRIRTYIETNPSTWETDKENPNKSVGKS